MPIIQLDFQNPLNASVQVGDIAYFANATPLGVGAHAHNPVDPQPPPPPHETASRENIIKIGPILDIKDFDGTTSHIQCNMDQVLFNKYAGDIIAGGCSYTPSLSNATGQMASMIRIANTPPVDPDNYHACPTCQTSTAPYVNPQTDYANPLPLLFSDNPTWSLHNTAFRIVADMLGTGVPPNITAVYNEIDYAAAGYPVADPNDPYYQPGRINTFARMAYFITTDDGVNYQYVPNVSTSNFPQPPYTWNDLTTNYPNAISQSLGPWAFLTGSVGPGAVNCIPGTFIMFSKDNKVNQADTLGYYALVEFRNNDFSNDSELFNAGVTYFNSSK